MKTPMRERLLDAAWQIVRAEGLAAMTTRAIALQANVAEGSIYKNFADKTDLVIALVLERAGDVRATFATLHRNAGKGSIVDNLTAALTDMIGFYENVQIVIAGALGDPDTMSKLRRVFREENNGPRRGHVAMIAYLNAERAAGRLPEDAGSPEILAALLLGAAHERAFLDLIEGERMTAARRRTFARQIAETIF